MSLRLIAPPPVKCPRDERAPVNIQWGQTGRVEFDRQLLHRCNTEFVWMHYSGHVTRVPKQGALPHPRQVQRQRDQAKLYFTAVR
jgi:hypothetical protein